MSFQPPVPPQDPFLTAPLPTVGGPPAGAAPAAVAPSGGRGLRTVGLLLAVLGLVGGAVLFVFSGREPERAVKGFARAPGGCRTTLKFDDTGTFTLFVETKGKVGNLSGDCAGADQDYDRDDEPDIELTLIDEDDEEVDLDRVSEPDYDTGDFVGTAVRTFDVDAAGTYRLRVESSDNDFAIAVGKDPDGAQGLMRLGAVLAAAGGVLLGLLLWLLGRRRRPTAAVASGPPSIPLTGAVYEPPYVGGPPHMIHPPDLVHPPPPPPPPLSAEWPTPPHPVGPDPHAPTAPLPQQQAPWADDQWRPQDPPPPPAPD